MTKIATCTINWNHKQDTIEFLESLKKLDTPGLTIKTFLVSNEKLGHLPAGRQDFELIFKKQNRGSAGGYNDAVKAGLKWGADYFLLVNNDILFNTSRLLTTLVQALKENPKAGAVSPKILFAPGFEFYKEKYSPQNRGHIIWYAGGDFDWNNINSRHQGIDQVDRGKYDEVSETGFVSGSAVLVKRAVFDQKIFWDEGLFAYLDDNDFQERVRRAGFKLYYTGQTSVYHKVSRTAGIGSEISDYYIARNRLIFGLRYAPLRTKLALLREAFNILLTGRPAQKQGILDFFLGKRGEYVVK